MPVLETTARQAPPASQTYGRRLLYHLCRHPHEATASMASNRKQGNKQQRSRGANNGAPTNQHTSDDHRVHRSKQTTLLPPLGKHKVERMEPARSPPPVDAPVSPPLSPHNARPVDALPHDRKRKAVEKGGADDVPERRTRRRRDKGADVALAVMKHHDAAIPMPPQDQIFLKPPREGASKWGQYGDKAATDSNAIPIGVHKRGTTTAPDISVRDTRLEDQALSREPESRGEAIHAVQGAPRDIIEHRDDGYQGDSRYSARHNGRGRERSPSAARRSGNDQVDRYYGRGRAQYPSGDPRREYQHQRRGHYGDTHRDTYVAASSQSPRRYRSHTPPRSGYPTDRSNSSRPRYDYDDNRPYRNDREYPRERGYTPRSRYEEGRDRRHIGFPQHADTPETRYQRHRLEDGHSSLRHYRTGEVEYGRSPTAQTPWLRGDANYHRAEADKTPQHGRSRNGYR